MEKHRVIEYDFKSRSTELNYLELKYEIKLRGVDGLIPITVMMTVDNTYNIISEYDLDEYSHELIMTDAKTHI